MQKRDPSYVHPAFPQPKDFSLTLWRYMDFDKFEWLINNSRLFLPRADYLGDPFEGTTPKGDLQWWQQKADNIESEEQKRIIEQNRKIISRTAKEFRELYYVSCWHCNEFENYAMWQCYTKNIKAVAVKTTYSKLRECLPGYVEMGMVRYIDYSKERLPSMNMFENIMHKDNYYHYENEVRAVAASFIAAEEWRNHFNENHFEIEKSPGFFIYAPPVDLTKLIQDVILHPKMPIKVQKKVDDFCMNAGLNKPILSRNTQKPAF